MALDPGDPLPESLTVLDGEGGEHSLAEFRGEATVLIFLRHLG